MLHHPPRAPRAARIALALLMAALGAAGCRPAPLPPGVLLVTVDTWRADHLTEPLAPNAWAVGSLGARYTDAWSPIGLTTAAHASLMTGLLPPEHGLRGNNHHGYALGPGPATLAERFAGAGWSTAAFVSAWPAGPEGGLDRGFQTFDGPEHGERPTAAAVEAATTWLAGRDGPWFLWVHAYDPHGPYAPPAEDLAAVGGGDDDAARYRGEVRAADRALGPLYQEVLRGGGWVAVTSDHGEIHGEERCGWQHERSSAPEVLRVPLVLAGPGVERGVFDARVGLTDLAPTLLSLAGISSAPADAGGELRARPLQGASTRARSVWIGESGLCDPECASGCAPTGFAGKDRVVYAGDRLLRERPGVGRSGDPSLAPWLEGYTAASPPTGDRDVEEARALGYTE